MNFKVGQFLQYVHLEPIRTGVISEGSEKGNIITKVVVKSHTFLLDHKIGTISLKTVVVKIYNRYN